MSRRRRTAERSPEEQREEAQLEVERAEDAVRYRRGQLAEAEIELASLSGPSGWLPALLGRKAALEAELTARISVLRGEVQQCRKRLIEARQALAKHDRAAAGREEQRRVRDAELERFAAKVRASPVHWLAEDLADVETRLQENADRIHDLDEALAACSGLSAAMGQVLRLAGHAKNRASMDAFRSPLPFTSELSFLKTREVKQEAQNLPDAIARFNGACERLGLSPLDIRVPELGSGWDQLLFDNILTDLHHLQRVQRFAEQLEVEREPVRDTLIWVTAKRREAVDTQERLLAERRTLLDEGLG